MLLEQEGYTNASDPAFHMLRNSVKIKMNFFLDIFHIKVINVKNSVKIKMKFFSELRHFSHK